MRGFKIYAHPFEGLFLENKVYYCLFVIFGSATQ